MSLERGRLTGHMSLEPVLRGYMSLEPILCS